MAKADFNDIYTAPDPRPYYRTLGGFDYQIPAHAASVFSQIAFALSGRETPRIVDLCCSYGVNAAVMRHELSFDQVIDHYTSPVFSRLTPEQFANVDRDFFGSHRKNHHVEVTGVDLSREAIEYALAAGLLDHGHAQNLEDEAPSDALVESLGRADLATVSGGIGYITEKSIARVFSHMRTPRLVALCLRWIDFGPIIDIGAAHGLVTERLDEATFPQRRFADDDERLHVENELDQLGIDPSGREAEGYHHTDLFVLRPEEEVAACPLDDLVNLERAVLEPEGDPDELEVSVFETSDDLR